MNEIKVYLDVSLIDEFLSLDSLNEAIKLGCKLKYEYAREKIYVSYYTGIPSNQSFIMFGGLYDPLTGLLYTSLYPNRESFVICNLADMINENIDVDLPTIKSAFLEYKITADEDKLHTSLFNEQVKSIIYRTLIKADNKSSEIKHMSFTEFLKHVLDIVIKYNTFNSDFLGFASSFLKFEPKTISAFDLDRLSQDNPLNFTLSYNLNVWRTCCKNTMLIGLSLIDSGSVKYKDNPAIVRMNIDEILNTSEDLVYCSTIEETLEKNIFNYPLSKDVLDEIKLSEVKNKDNYSFKDKLDDIIDYEDDDFYYTEDNRSSNLKFESLIKEIIRINKRILRI